MKLQKQLNNQFMELGQGAVSTKQENTSSILEQIFSAFDKRPQLDHVFHGVRRIKLGKHGSRSSLFYSKKCGGFIPVESRLELRHCYQLEADRTVKRYRTQAIKIPRAGKYLVPDFLIEFVDGKFEVHEVKLDVRLGNEALRLKLQFALEFLLADGLAYRVITEKNLPQSHVEQNIVMLYDRGGRLTVSELQLDLLRKLVLAILPGERTVCRIREELRRVGMPSFLLENALFSGVLSCELAHPIRSQSLVEVPA
ncbi:hypothetical protein GJ697_09885 [Pseudoduganella sp. FT25W]|uniref:Uncharacterized protein n=1 Tax=Duganella alba TaxID=2666081 RepID=A0A6L5QFU9_9BURK|nr:TnsA endonuclease N-terminal domain-containing protein [Duganella alba]MRX08142.1 hypothetical protein [Duganella alba]MRX16321.1 hypothetical protein [Duganella alba]